MITQIYPTELQLSKAYSSDTEALCLDLHLLISNDFILSKIYDKRDDFDFDIVNFPVLDGDVLVPLLMVLTFLNLFGLQGCLVVWLTPVVYSTDRSKAVVPVIVLLFVALWFILRGDLLYVLPCVILFLCISVLLTLQLPRLGKRELILVLFVRLFDLCLFGFVGFLFLLMSGKGCGLWLWYSLEFSPTCFFNACNKTLTAKLLQQRYR